MLGIETAPCEARPASPTRRLVSNLPAPDKLRPAEPNPDDANALGGRKMTPELLRELTNSEPGCYEAPHLNEKLYLNRRGFRVIENLEPYTNVVGLFLDSNGIHEIQNIGHMTSLRMLYLENNCISKIQGLETLSELHTLNLSGNNLSVVEGLQGLTKLESLYLQKNKICSLADLAGVKEAPEVSMLDVSHNMIEDTENVATTLSTLVPKLKCLAFNNNPNKRFLQNYRRDFISKIPGLTFLDDRKVDELERKTSNAWGRGMTRKEIEAARVAHIEQKRLEQRASIEAMMKVQAERAAEVQRQRAAAERGEVEEASEHTDINVQRPLGSTATPRVTKRTAVSEDVANDEAIAAPLKEMWYGRPKKDAEKEGRPTEAPAAAPSAEPASAEIDADELKRAMPPAARPAAQPAAPPPVSPVGYPSPGGGVKKTDQQAAPAVLSELDMLD